jgi:L-asparagine transporter-like permease
LIILDRVLSGKILCNALHAPYETHLQDFSMGTASEKCVSTTIATRLGWTGWLLVLVYFGALTAISDYIAHWFLFSEELLFYEVFIIISTAVTYVLAQVHSALRDKNSTSKWWGRGLKVLSIIFGAIRFFLPEYWTYSILFN